ncbi:MAG: cation diffusion facilitator family transporter, partial [Planctomycetota bacterium]|nr:cation diffusion facilitator family transporter [Planctomycetota bacterium]
MADSSKTSVVAAIAGNSVILVAKSAGFFVTGSGAMLSEAIHTLADLLNQILLLVGIKRSEREADERFPVGYGRERYVWALISAVGIFFLGCGVTIYHGVTGLLHPHETESPGWAVAVLSVSFVLEGIVFLIALKGLKKEAAGKPFFPFLRNEADPSAAAVLLEDFAACFGVLLALTAIGLSSWTGALYWDSIGSIAIGLLLGVVAILLIVRNHNLLVGPAVPADVRQAIHRILREHPTVERVVKLRASVIDLDRYDITATIDFDGAKIAERIEGQLARALNETDADPKALALSV